MRRNLNKGDVSQGREDHNRQAPLQRDHYGGSTTSPKRQGFQEKSWFPNLDTSCRGVWKGLC